MKRKRFLLGALAALLLGLIVGCTSSANKGGGADATVSNAGAGGPGVFSNFFEFLFVAERNAGQLEAFEIRVDRDQFGNPSPSGNIDDGGGQPQGRLNTYTANPTTAGTNWVAIHPSQRAMVIVGRGVNRTTSDGDDTGASLVSYFLEPTTGQMSPAPAPFPIKGGLTPGNPDLFFSALFHPNGNFLYVFGDGGVQVWAYNVVNGDLAQVQVANATAGFRIGILGPNGAFIYATNQTTGQVFRFTINPNGSLTDNGPVAVGPRPLGLTLDTTGTRLYVANQGAFRAGEIVGPPPGVPEGSISGFSINQTTGVLTPLAGFPVTTAGGGVALEDPTGLAVQAGTNRLYLTDKSAAGGAGGRRGFVAGYQIGAGGGLAPLPNSPFGAPAAFDNPVQLIVEPMQTFIYVACQADPPGIDPDETFLGQIVVYRILGDGSLNPIQVHASDNPFGLAVLNTNGLAKQFPFNPNPNGDDGLTAVDTQQPGIAAMVIDVIFGSNLVPLPPFPVAAPGPVTTEDPGAVTPSPVFIDFRAFATLDTGDVMEVTEFATFSVLGIGAGPPPILLQFGQVVDGVTDPEGRARVQNNTSVPPVTQRNRVDATLNNIETTTDFNVDILNFSIAVTPTNPTVAAGATQQFTAVRTWTDGRFDNVTATATWTSTALNVATINATGLATAVATGTSTIRATFLGVNSNDATLTVP